MITDITPHKSIETRYGSFLADAILIAYCALTFGLLEPSLDVPSGIPSSLQQAVNAGAANVINQLIWLSVAGVALIAVRKKIAQLVSLSGAAWPLMVVFAYCFVSAGWSDQPLVSIRRCFALIVPTFSLLAAVATFDRPERAGRILYFSLWLALLANLGSLTLPGSFDNFGFFKGITSNKNTLGALGALAILAGLGLSPLISGLFQRVFLLIYLTGWAELLLLSVSKTSIALTAIIPILFLTFAFIALCFRISIRFQLLLVVLAFGFAAILASLWLQVSIDDFSSLFWHDTTFSGRTQIWSFMLDNIKRDWLFGIGFGSFWEAGSNSPNLHASLDYVRLLNQAHNGYLDVAATLGTVGLVLVSIMLANMMRKADRLRTSYSWAYRFSWLILLFGLIHNTMESSLLVPFHMVWHTMLLSYVIASRMSQVSA